MSTKLDDKREMILSLLNKRKSILLDDESIRQWITSSANTRPLRSITIFAGEVLDSKKEFPVQAVKKRNEMKEEKSQCNSLDYRVKHIVPIKNRNHAHANYFKMLCIEHNVIYDEFLELKTTKKSGKLLRHISLIPKKIKHTSIPPIKSKRNICNNARKWFEQPSKVTKSNCLPTPRNNSSKKNHLNMKFVEGLECKTKASDQDKKIGVLFTVDPHENRRMKFHRFFEEVQSHEKTLRYKNSCLKMGSHILNLLTHSRFNKNKK